MKQIVAETEIVINAPIERVWQIMLNTSDYPKWNPFVVKVDSSGDNTQAGTRMKLYVRWNNGKEVTSNEIITDTKRIYLDEAGNKCAHWSYRFTGILDQLGLVRAVRYQWLKEKEGKTFYRTREEFNSLLKKFIPLADVQDGFERQAKALKKYAETI